MEIFTIGFAGKTAERFFESLKQAGVRQLVDVRLNNVSQLAGFTKMTDLPYFLDRLASIEYRDEPLLTPEKVMFKAYRAKKIDWVAYEEAYRHLLFERDVAAKLEPAAFREPIVLLCSESSPERCHRRLAAEHLRDHWPAVTLHHL